MNNVLQSIFKIWNFLPLFQMLFLWLNKTPLNEILLLVFKRVLIYHFWNTTFSPFLNIIGYQLKILQRTKFLKLVVVRSFCFGLLLSPPLAWIAKNGIIRALEVFSSPLAINKWVKIIPKTKSFCLVLMLSPPEMESCLEWQRRMNYGVEAFVFAEDSNFLSIHLWLGLK